MQTLDPHEFACRRFCGRGSPSSFGITLAATAVNSSAGVSAIRVVFQADSPRNERRFGHQFAFKVNPKFGQQLTGSATTKSPVLKDPGALHGYRWQNDRAAARTFAAPLARTYLTDPRVSLGKPESGHSAEAFQKVGKSGPCTVNGEAGALVLLRCPAASPVCRLATPGSTSLVDVAAEPATDRVPGQAAIGDLIGFLEES